MTWRMMHGASLVLLLMLPPITAWGPVARLPGCACRPARTALLERRPQPRAAAVDVASAVVEATSAAAVQFAITGNSNGDPFAREGIDPVVDAAKQAAASDAAVIAEIDRAVADATGRTNANAESVANEIILAMMQVFGAPKPPSIHRQVAGAEYSTAHQMAKLGYKKAPERFDEGLIH